VPEWPKPPGATSSETLSSNGIELRAAVVVARNLTNREQVAAPCDRSNSRLCRCHSRPFEKAEYCWSKSTTTAGSRRSF